MSRFGKPPKSTPRFGEQSNNDDDDADSDPCWKILKAYLKFKVLDDPLKQPKIRLKSFHGGKSWPHGHITVDCVCEHNMDRKFPPYTDWKEYRNGHVTAVGDCDEDGWTHIIFVKVQKQRWDCATYGNEGVKGLENFCGGLTQRKICKDFPLKYKDALHTGVLNNGDLIDEPVNHAAEQMCFEDPDMDMGGEHIPTEIGCSPHANDLYMAALNCGYNSATAIGPNSPYPIWNVANAMNPPDDSKVNCLLEELKCGGDKKVQAALMNKMLNDNHNENDLVVLQEAYRGSASKVEEDSIFPSHDCETGECDWTLEKTCKDDTKDCDDDPGGKK